MGQEYFVLVTLNGAPRQQALFVSYRDAAAFVKDWEEDIKDFIKEGELGFWETRLCEVVKHSIPALDQSRFRVTARDAVERYTGDLKAVQMQSFALIDQARRMIRHERLEEIKRMRKELPEEPQKKPQKKRRTGENRGKGSKHSA